MDAETAFKTGALLGELTSSGIDAKPVYDGPDYTNQIIIDMAPPFGRVRITIEVV